MEKNTKNKECLIIYNLYVKNDSPSSTKCVIPGYLGSTLCDRAQYSGEKSDDPDF